MDKKHDKTCIYFRGIEDCICNNDPDDLGECVYEQGIEPPNPAAPCKYYDTLKTGGSDLIHRATNKHLQGATKETATIEHKLSAEGAPAKRVRIYQIEPIDSDFAFRSIADLKARGLASPPPNLYKIVYDGQPGTNDLERIHVIFNIAHPQGYTGRSLTASDIVEICDDRQSIFYYCDTFGFEQICFKPVS